MISGVFGHKLVITSQNWNELFRELYRAVHRWRWSLIALDLSQKCKATAKTMEIGIWPSQPFLLIFGH